MNYLNEDNNNRVIVVQTTKTVQLTLTKAIISYANGTTETKRDTEIAYSQNVNANEVNITSIVEEVSAEVNDFLNHKASARCEEI